MINFSFISFLKVLIDAEIIWLTISFQCNHLLMVEYYIVELSAAAYHGVSVNQLSQNMGWLM